MEIIEADKFAELFLLKYPMIDVRAPIEFSKGAFPNAVNLPILNDSERQKVGHCYKVNGADVAVKLGHQLVSGEIKHNRIKQWKDYVLSQPQAVLYCFRGGMRSTLSQQWLSKEGINIARVEGGYKALRNFLLDQIEEQSKAENIIVIGGRTGTGKTRVIHRLESCLDLEGLANHRGSAFGKQPTSQPTQINFENKIAINLLKLKQLKTKKILIEDESKLIGKNALPIKLKQAMLAAELVVVKEPIEDRIQVVIDEYVTDLLEQFKRANPQASFNKVFELYQRAMNKSLQSIQKRIGGERYDKLSRLMGSAMQLHFDKNDKSLHSSWIKPLLMDYYDKMYDYQLKQKNNRIIFEGNRKEVIAFLETK